jgi:3-oxoacyl-[acyl-carrier protein] reductase
MNILITGTSKGLGKYLAEYYSKNNRVFGCGRTHISGWDNYDHFMVDITNENQVIDLVKNINHIDVLINNAGVASMNHAILTSLQSVKNTFDVNFNGTFLMCREVIKKMIYQKHGRIINISSVAVPLNLEGEMVYASSKAAVEKMTQILAKEVGTFGITVNTVSPTPMNDGLIRNVPKDKIANIINLQSIKRLGKFEDISNVIDFYINSEFITGQTIYLGGIC